MREPEAASEERDPVVRAYLRGAPAGLPFPFDEETLAKGLNFARFVPWI